METHDFKCRLLLEIGLETKIKYCQLITWSWYFYLDRHIFDTLDKLDELSYVVEAWNLIASPSYPDLVGAYWKGTLTPKATSAYAQQTGKKINYRGISIYRIQNGKMVETWHVVDGGPSKL
jgi:predicted ester cyclase